MSSPVTPVRFDGPSLVAIKGLLERNLVDRAVTLAESRWPGSGPLVELSYEWAQLSPADRRDRLTTIGPEELGRLRGVAELQPDLARVLDDLEARGIIPPALPVAVPMEVDRELTREEQVVDAVLDLAGEQIVETANALEPRLVELRQHIEAAAVDRMAGTRQVPSLSTPAGGRSETIEDASAVFVADLAEQRLRATEHANQALERVRATIERSAARLRDRPIERGPDRRKGAPERDRPDVPAMIAAAEVASRPHGDVSNEQRASIHEIVARLRNERVVAMEGVGARGLAIKDVSSALGSTVTVLVPDDIGRRAFYGGLRREGRDVAVEVGAFPRSLAAPGLTVVRGRMLPSAIARIREGYVDIPGTRASTRVHPEARVLVLSD